MKKGLLIVALVALLNIGAAAQDREPAQHVVAGVPVTAVERRLQSFDIVWCTESLDVLREEKR